MLKPIIDPILVLAEKLTKLVGFVTDIETDTIKNKNFRKVLYTGKNSQLVLMSLKPGEEIGTEVHEGNDQFFRIEKGNGTVVINGKKHKIKDGSAIVIPQGAEHNVINDSDKEELSLYTIYSPPHHKDKVIHKTKEDAEKDKMDEFKKPTEKYAKMDLAELYHLETEFQNYLRERRAVRAISTLEKIMGKVDDLTIEMVKEEKTPADKVRTFRQLVDFGLPTAAYVIKWLEDPEKTKKEITDRCK